MRVLNVFVWYVCACDVHAWVVCCEFVCSVCDIFVLCAWCFVFCVCVIVFCICVRGECVYVWCAFAWCVYISVFCLF